MENAPKRDHRGVIGAKIPPERIIRAEQLFAGTGPEGVPYSTREIEKTLAAEYGISKRQARQYLTLARQNLARLAAQSDEHPGALVERADAMLLNSFRTAKAKGDASSMVQASQRLAELRGVYKREVKIEAQVSGLAEALHSVMDAVKREANEATEPEDADSGAETVARRPG